NGEEILDGWNQRHAKRLLVYLVFHSSVTREQLCADLWGHEEIVRSRQNLRVYLTHLRKLLRDDENRFILYDHEHIHLRGIIECDALQYINRLHEAMLEQDMRKKADLSKPLFDMYHRSLFWNFSDDWILDVRESMEHQLLEL